LPASVHLTIRKHQINKSSLGRPTLIIVPSVLLQPPPGLPRRTYVNLTQVEEAAISRVMDNKLGEAAIMRQKRNLTTNRCEATHLTVLKSVPKSRVFRRNFKGRAHSAIHSSSLGLTQSVLHANALLGAANDKCSPANRTRIQEIKRDIYNKERKRSLKYRVLKKHCKDRKLKFQNCSKTSGYSPGCQDPVVCGEHEYPKTENPISRYLLRPRSRPRAYTY
jgi:hypothetical protein